MGKGPPRTEPSIKVKPSKVYERQLSARQYGGGEMERRNFARKAEMEARCERLGVTMGPPSLPPLELDLANHGLDDSGLTYYFKDLMWKLDQKTAEPTAQIVDLSWNKLTDIGVSSLAAFLKNYSVTTKEIRLQGNLLREPTALVELLSDDSVGLGAGLRSFRLSAEGLTHEFFWRICEVCCRFHPRPPFSLCLDGGRLGSLEKVLPIAEGRGLRVGKSCDWYNQDVDLLLGDMFQ